MNVDVKIVKFNCDKMEDEKCLSHCCGYGFIKVTILNGEIFHTILDGHCIIVKKDDVKHLM